MASSRMHEHVHTLVRAVLAATKPLAVEGDVVEVATNLHEAAKGLRKVHSRDRLEYVVVGRMARCFAPLLVDAGRLHAFGDSRCPKRKIAIRSLAPDSMAHNEIPISAGKGYRRPSLFCDLRSDATPPRARPAPRRHLPRS